MVFGFLMMMTTEPFTVRGITRTWQLLFLNYFVSKIIHENENLPTYFSVTLKMEKATLMEHSCTLDSMIIFCWSSLDPGA